MSTILVGIADMKIARSPDILTTLGLGSCVGVTIFDPYLRVGGLIHVLLPTRSKNDSASNLAKYADTGIPELLKKLAVAGCNQNSLIAKIAGGANMFSANGKSDFFMIGERNAGMCREILKNQRIRIAGEDTGGNYGRTIELNAENGQLRIKTIGHGEKFI